MKILLLSPWDNCWVKYLKKYFKALGHTLTHSVTLDFFHVSKHDAVICGWADPIAAKLSWYPKLCSKYIGFIRSYEFFNGMVNKVNWPIFDKIFVLNKYIQGKLKIDTQIIKNGIDLEEYPYKQREPGKKVVFLANISHKKGIPLLLQIAYSLPDFEFHVYGQVQEKRFGDYLLLRKPDNIIFHGYVQDKYGAFKDKQYVLCTSPVEGNPNGIIECMALGLKPVIHKYLGIEGQFPEENCFMTIKEAEGIFREEYHKSCPGRNFIEENYDYLKVYKSIAEAIECTV